MGQKYNEYGIQETTTKKGNKNFLTLLLILALLLIFVVGLSVATQKVALAYSYHPGLGEPLFFFFNIYWYSPFSILEWQEMIDPTVFDDAYTTGLFVCFIPLLVGCVIAYLMSNRMKGNATLHGSAHWAKLEEIQKLNYFTGRGVFIGGYWEKKKKKHHCLTHNGPEHILCFAPTRSGKGVGLILPTLYNWPGSSITLDIKGENWALTSGFRQSKGHLTFRFDPTDASGAACKFNPLEEVRLNTLEGVQDAQNMALMLVDPDGKGLEDYWNKAGYALLSGVLLFCCIEILAEKKHFANLTDLVLMLSGSSARPIKSNEDDDGNKTGPSLLLDMQDEARIRGYFEKIEDMFHDPEPNVVNQRFKEWKIDEAAVTEFFNFMSSSGAENDAKAPNEFSGVLSTALSNMALYRDPIISKNIKESDLHIFDLMNHEKAVDLYLVVSPAAIDRVRPLMRLIVDLIVRRICADMKFENGASVAGYKHRCLLMLDEFTSLGKLPIMEKAIAYIAGYGGKMYIIVQDTKQLNNVYGRENAIMANCHVRIAYAPNDPETAELLSKMTGTTTVVEKKTSISSGKGGGSKSTNISETSRALLTADECMRLPGAEKDADGKVIRPGHMLIFTAGQSPIYGMQILYFKDAEMTKRSKMPPPGVCERFPAGITDSIYYPRPKNWYTGEPDQSEQEQVMSTDPDIVLPFEVKQDNFLEKK